MGVKNIIFGISREGKGQSGQVPRRQSRCEGVRFLSNGIPRWCWPWYHRTTSHHYRTILGARWTHGPPALANCACLCVCVREFLKPGWGEGKGEIEKEELILFEVPSRVPSPRVIHHHRGNGEGFRKDFRPVNIALWKGLDHSLSPRFLIQKYLGGRGEKERKHRLI
ncbi:hypothetical protein PoB_000454700 [Plakobranchus ocellatus]|uniref:Uncharacterized protein n=1 Tax=Plakobranchus ocellatus TaxID=259542 RepID=A0AAV3Y6F1_9GAST|nr:hypothetical protein PoB_000454700 [Plakobranchus ocellatus]